MLFHIYIPK